MELDKGMQPERVWITQLFDFYGDLLSKQQQLVLDLHLNSDLSLAEIAEELHVSRQAVHDAIKAGKDALDRYEGVLKLNTRLVSDRICLVGVIDLIHKAEMCEEPEAAKILLKESATRLSSLMESW